MAQLGNKIYNIKYVNNVRSNVHFKTTNSLENIKGLTTCTKRQNYLIKIMLNKSNITESDTN